MAQPLNLSPQITPAPYAWMLTPSRGVTADYPGMTAVSTLANSLRPSGSSSPVAIAFTWLASPKPAARIRLMAHTRTLPSRAPFAPPGRMDPRPSSRAVSRARPPSLSTFPAQGASPPFLSTSLPSHTSPFPSLPPSPRHPPPRDITATALSLANLDAPFTSRPPEIPWPISGLTIATVSFSVHPRVPPMSP